MSHLAGRLRGSGNGGLDARRWWCPIRFRQSDIKRWGTCPLQYKYANLDGLPRIQTCAVTFGSIIHDVILWMEVNRDLPGAIHLFQDYWIDPTRLDPSYEIQKWLPKRSFESYAQDGARMLRSWWAIIEWDADVVLGREQHFVVPIGDGHELEGTLDKLVVRYKPKTDSYALVVSDYKTSRKVPSYGYLRQDLQFSAYCYATTQPEFWTGVDNGEHLRQQVMHLPREAEWVQLTAPQRKHAGDRNDQDYNRITYAVNAMAASIDMRIFVPNISGESCTFCDFRERCGLPDLETEGHYKPMSY